MNNHLLNTLGRIALLITFNLSLVACGGGGGGSSDGGSVSFTVSTSASANGAISPTSTSVNENSSTHFTLTPEVGFSIEAASGCGGTLAGNTYTTGPITADCTVTVSFLERTLDTVSALFSNAANWNDYAKGASWATATNTACDASLDSACIHGGEVRVVQVTGKTSCDGLTAEDDLAAFNWVCDATGGTARFISDGLADGKSLSDLINFSIPDFEANAVTVYDNGSLWGTTPSSNWWSNTVVDISGGGSITGELVIYLITSDEAASYTIDAAKVALVVQPGVTLSGPVTPSDIISSVGQDYLWLEGSINASDNNLGIFLDSVRFSTVRNVSVEYANATGIYLINASTHNRLTDITASNNNYGIDLDSGTQDNVFSGLTLRNNAQNGIEIHNAHANTLTGVVASDNGGMGIFIRNSSSNNTLSNVAANNNGDAGISINASHNNSLTAVVASNNNTSGVQIVNNSYGNSLSVVTASKNGVGVSLDYAWNSTLANITVSNSNTGIVINFGANNRLSGLTAASNSIGMQFLAGDNNTVSGVTVTDNTDYGVIFGGSNSFVISGLTSSNNGTGIYLGNGADDNTLLNIAAANNNTGITLVSVSNNAFSGLLEVGNNSVDDCDVTGGVTPGLDTDCASGASLISDISLASAFVGKVNADSTNVSDSNGTASFPADPAVFDWSDFDNTFRGWGIDSALAFPNVDQRGKWTAGSGRIWDWSVSSGDAGNAGSPALRDLLAMPTGNETITHSWFNTSGGSLDNTVCSTMVTGSTYNGADCETTFLRNSVEIQNDGIGNDNTLCESGESCLYTPNIGSYQGHGNLVSAGTFTAGTLTGITLMKYGTNGY